MTITDPESDSSPGERNPCALDIWDGLSFLVSFIGVTVSDYFIASHDYPGCDWPHAVGREALAQAARWIVLGLFIAGPVVLGKQRWLTGRAQRWDFAEHMWCWIPCVWVALVVASRTLPENPLLLFVLLGAIFIAPPVMLIAGAYGIWRIARTGIGHWTTAVGSTITAAVGLWAAVELFRNPLAL